MSHPTLSWYPRRMDYVRLGSTGLKVSRLCLGCMTYGSKKWRDWVLEEEESRPFFQRALEVGINFFDTADMYSDRRERRSRWARAQGHATARDRSSSPPKSSTRWATIPTSAAFRASTSTTPSTTACAASAPITSTSTRFTASTTTRPIEETLERWTTSCARARRSTSAALAMYAWQFAKMLAASDRAAGALRHHAESLQPGLPRRRARDDSAVPGRRHRHVPWSPLARGFLAGNRSAQASARRPAPRPMISRRKCTTSRPTSPWWTVSPKSRISAASPTAQVALAWVLQQPGVTAPIIGASKMQHLDEAVAALNLKLDPAELKALAEPYQPHRVLGHPNAADRQRNAIRDAIPRGRLVFRAGRSRDLGLYVLKFHGAGQGPLALAAEIIAGEIGRALGLKVPELVLMEVDAALGRNEPDFEIRELLRASTGLNMALDFLPGSVMFDPAAGDPAGEDLASSAVWFDAFVTKSTVPRATRIYCTGTSRSTSSTTAPRSTSTTIGKTRHAKPARHSPRSATTSCCRGRRDSAGRPRSARATQSRRARRNPRPGSRRVAPARTGTATPAAKRAAYVDYFMDRFDAAPNSWRRPACPHFTRLTNE